MQNVELKAVYPDLALGRELASSWGARRKERILQVDTFFHARFGRLKLREFGEGQPGELIAYDREDTAEARTSDYEILTMSDPEVARCVLTRALGVKVVVKKQRELWIWENVRIHLDSVEHLGNFIEFEAVLGARDDAALGRQHLESLTSHFRIKPEAIQRGAYADLIMARSD